MKAKIWLLNFVTIYGLGWACLPAFADTVVYSTDFSTNPGWVTDQPGNYYWNGSIQTYFVHNTNTYPGYYPNRYAGKTMDEPVGSFELQWDINVTQCDWSAGLYFGIWDSSLREPGWGYGGEFIMAVIGRADAGHCINLEVAANGLIAEASTYPGWSLDKWYTFKISYDSDAEVANLEVLDRATAESIWTTSLVVPGGGFTRDLVFLGSNLGMVGSHGYSGISPSAVLEANLDNVVLSIPEPEAPDTDGDGIPDEEDADDDNDGFNDWLEEIIGTDPLDENDVPDLDDIEGTTLSIVENLALAAGVEKSLIDKIEDVVKSADNLIQSANNVLALLDEIDALYNSGRISFEDLAILESLLMKFLPFREPIYYECIPEDGYLIHRFEFNEEQMTEMAQSAFKAQPYANWMIDKVMTIADGMGADLGKLIGRFTLAFSSSSMARASLDEGWETMGIEIRSHASEEGKWALEFADDVAGIWKKLTLGW